MNPRVRTSLIFAATAAALCVVGVVALADPPEGDAEGPERSHQLLREYISLNMDLGRYALLNGDYETAAGTFLLVAELERPEPPPPPEAVEGPEREGRRHRGHRGPRRRGPEMQTEAYFMAAVATYLAGDHEGAIALAQSAQESLPERPRPAEGEAAEEGARGRGAREMRRPRTSFLQRFLDDPEGVAGRWADGVAGLQARLLEIEAELGDNVVVE